MTTKRTPPTSVPGRKCPRWTAEEDRILRESPARMTSKQLQKTIHKATGNLRHLTSIMERRRLVNPDYDLEPHGWIRLGSIAKMGQNNLDATAQKFAERDGVLKYTVISGKKIKIVPMQWADQWITRKQHLSDQRQYAIDNGWYTTARIAEALGKPTRGFFRYLDFGLKGIGVYTAFKDVQIIRGPGRALYWEPTATRAAIERVKIQISTNKRLRRHLWSAKRVAALFGVTTYALCKNAQYRELLALVVEADSMHIKYWHPEDVINWAKRNGFSIEEDA